MSRRTLILWTGAVYFLLLCGCVALVVSRPLAFQKSNSIVRADEIPPISATSPALDVEPIVVAIPFVSKGRNRQLYEVDPAAKYRATMLRGIGTCSNLSHGLGYRLGEGGMDFQIIDLLPTAEFLRGGGHTVLRARYRYRGAVAVGLIDLLNAGLPYSGTTPIDADDLRHGPIENFHIEHLNKPRGYGPPYGPFLARIVVSFTPAEELLDYNRFIDSVYVPLGSPRVEKRLYDGLAFLVGMYPTRHVLDYDRLVATHRTEIFGHQLSLWVFRSAVFVLPVFCAVLLVRRRRRVAREAPASCSTSA